MQITIKKVGITPEQLIKDIDFKFTSVKKGLKVLADESKQKMDTVIYANKKDGADGTLKKEIKVEKTKQGYGIGNIDYLKIYAPHWAMINYGGFLIANQPKRKSPYFVPGYWEGSRFRYAPNSGRGMQLTANSYINPKNYIEKTISWIESIINIKFNSWTKKTLIITR